MKAERTEKQTDLRFKTQAEKRCPLDQLLLQDGKHAAQKFVELSSTWCQLMAFFGSENLVGCMSIFFRKKCLNCDWVNVPLEVPLQRKSIFSFETKKG